MNQRRSVSIALFLGLTGSVFFAAVGELHAQQGKAGKKVSPAVAKVDSISGVLLRKMQQKWLPVKEGVKIRTGTQLVSFPKTQLRSASGAVSVLMISDIGKRGIYPILETAVVLKKNPKADFDITFERGLLVLTNEKKKGPGKVRLRLRNAVWDLTLKEPGTKVVVESFSQHMPGLPTLAGLKTKGPMTQVVLLVVKGKALLEVGDEGFGLTAPPGQALVMWDNLQPKPLVQRLEKMPEQIRPADEKEKKLLKQIDTCISCFMTKETGEALDELGHSKEKVNRLVGVTMMGAVDDLPRLVDALADAKHDDVREHAIVVLRNWMGREPGQVKKVYSALVKKKNYSRVHALTIMQLLFGFNDKQKGDPRIYQMLIHYLNNSRLPIRELAHWHLVRLAPKGKDIAYNAAAPENERQKAVQQWRRLIPRGELPAASKTAKKK